ncbi:MAG: hypothetical protein AB1630_05780 [bacterium]
MLRGFLGGIVIMGLLKGGYAATSASALQVIEASIMPTRQINIDEEGKIIEIWSNNSSNDYRLWLQVGKGQLSGRKRVMLKDVNKEIPDEIKEEYRDILEQYEKISAITDYHKAGLVYKYIPPLVYNTPSD